MTLVLVAVPASILAVGTAAQLLVDPLPLGATEKLLLATLVMQGVLAAVGLYGWRLLRGGWPTSSGGVAVRSMAAGVGVAVAQAVVNRLTWVAAHAAGLGPWAEQAFSAEARAQAAMVLGLPAPWAALSVTTVLLVAPVAEELFFRGFLYRYLRIGALLPPLAAALVSGLAFGGIHGFAAHLPGLWATGVLLALWYERAGRLDAAVGAHMTANGLGLWLLFALGTRPPAP